MERRPQGAGGVDAIFGVEVETCERHRDHLDDAVDRSLEFFVVGTGISIRGCVEAGPLGGHASPGMANCGDSVIACDTDRSCRHRIGEELATAQAQ